jgi:hypothetical protein
MHVLTPPHNPQAAVLSVPLPEQYPQLLKLLTSIAGHWPDESQVRNATEYTPLADGPHIGGETEVLQHSVLPGTQTPVQAALLHT